MNLKSLLIIFLIFSFAQKASASLCKKEFRVAIKMEDDWYKKEELRKQKEELLLNQYSNYITKRSKPLVAEKYECAKGEECDPIKNCQMERNIKDLRDEEYLITTDSGIIIAKSYCSVIGKCIGYNDFFHDSQVTAAEDRLVDVKKNNAVFYHYFYSARSQNYEPLFNITNFNTGSELYFKDVPHFSFDEKFIIEVNSSNEFGINIYQLNQAGEYQQLTQEEFDWREANCGETPYFHSWKSEYEARISQTPPSLTNAGQIKILFFDEKQEKWSCKDNILPPPQCEYYLPNSVEFSSNLSADQVKNCL